MMLVMSNVIVLFCFFIVMLAPAISQSLPEIYTLCKSQGVQRMSIFGSATTHLFSTTSDVDCLVKFFNSHLPGISDRYWELAQGLEAVLKRPVDLITERSVRNPIFRAAIERSKILIYESPSTKISF